MTQGWSFICILVFPDSKKHWLAETVIPRPFREFYLADHHRLNPVATLHFDGSQSLVPTTPTYCREIQERTLFNLDLSQFRKESAEKLIAKAGSDCTSKFKFRAFVESIDFT